MSCARVRLAVAVLLAAAGRLQAGCPAECQRPRCETGDWQAGGQPLLGGVCTYYCSPPVNGVRSCGFGATFERNGAVDCGGCDRDFAGSGGTGTPAKGILDASYITLSYSFEMRRLNMNSRGRGKLWLKFENGHTFVRIQGMATSPVYGKGQITVVADGAKNVVYAMFDMENLHEVQCLKYNFPAPEDNKDQLQILDWRLKPLGRDADLHRKLLRSAKAIHAKWSPSSDLVLDLDSDGMLRRIETRRDGKAVKRIEIDGGLTASTTAPDSAASLFEAPSPHCRAPRDTKQAVASLELRPPNGRSSALQDMLLAMQTYSGSDVRLFLILSAFALPGEIAVMIDDPVPPRFENFRDVAFDYSSTIHRGGIERQSNGSVWMDVQRRAFHLRGEAKKTKIGPLFVDVLAQGAPGGQIYVNVDLVFQEKHQCVIYPFPDLPEKSTNPLVQAAGMPMRFSHLVRFKGEDCGIFIAPLTRSRTVRIWVDLDSVTNSPAKAILRTEVLRNDKTIRSTDILKWKSGTGASAPSDLEPKAPWACSPHAGGGELATIGISKVHKRSLELQDAFYAVRGLPRQFAVIEVFALTGDVALMVDEPDVPDFGKLADVFFKFNMQLTPGHHGRIQESSGRFAANVMKKEALLEMGVQGDAGVAVALRGDRIAVRLHDGSCVETRVSAAGRGESEDLGDAVASAGLFDSVDVIEDAECNRFTFLGSQTYDHNVDLWYDIEGNSVRRLKVLPKAEPDSDDPRSAIISISSWQRFTPGKSPEDWSCELVDADPASLWKLLPGANGIHKDQIATAGTHAEELLGALGVVGMLTPSVKAAFARLAGRSSEATIHTPDSGTALRPTGAIPPPTTSSTTTTTLPVDIMSPNLRYFTFGFRSTYPLQRGSAGGGSIFATGASHGGGVGLGPHWHRGSGTMTVDLATRRFALHSEAVNVSAGIPHVFSSVVFRGDRQRLYSRTKIPVQGFDQCWSVSTAEALPPPRGGAQPNPFTRALDSGAGTMMVLGRETTKYSMPLGEDRRAVMYVDVQKRSLVALNVDDLQRDVSTGVIMKDWSTSPAAAGAFELGEDWVCEDMQSVSSLQDLASWDLMQLFFPLVTVDDGYELEGAPGPPARKLSAVDDQYKVDTASSPDLLSV